MMKKEYKQPVLVTYGDLKEITKSGYGSGDDLRGETGPDPS